MFIIWFVRRNAIYLGVWLAIATALIFLLGWIVSVVVFFIGAVYFKVESQNQHTEWQRERLSATSKQAVRPNDLPKMNAASLVGQYGREMIGESRYHNNAAQGQT